MCKLIISIVLSILFLSCNSDHSSRKLEELDRLLSGQPAMVLDSLKKIDVSTLSKEQKAHYYLLEASALDKNFIPLPNDSMLRLSQKYFEGIEDHYNVGKIQYYLARYLSRQNDDKKVIYDLLKQAEINLKKAGRQEEYMMGLIYYRLGMLQGFETNLFEAENYHKKAIEIFSTAKDTISTIHTLKQLGQIYISKKKFEEAKKLLQDALILSESLQNESTQKIVEVKATVLTSLGFLYNKMSDIPSSLKFGKESINTLRKAKLKIPSSYYHNMFLVFNKMVEPDSAKFYCYQMIHAAEEENSLINIINGYRLLFKLEEHQGNYKEACLLKDKFNELKDDYSTKTDKKNFIELEKKYDLTEKEKQVLQVKNNMLWSGIIGLFILSIATVSALHIYHRHKKLKIDFKVLSEDVKHTKWGFSISKELITYNYNTYDALERLLAKNRVPINNPKLYGEFEELFKTQKADYSARLFTTLTDVDDAFIKRLQSRFPDLLPDDILIAAMLRHQWSVTDIATVFCVSLEAIRKRKGRLKKKILGKEESTVLLEDYLAEI